MRLVDERARQRDALALAAGELRRPALAERAELHELEHFARALRALVAAPTPRTRGPYATFSSTRHVREQRVVLEHGVDVALVRRHVGDVRAVEQHLPAVGLLEARDQPQARGLARARGPEHREELAGLRSSNETSIDRAHVTEDARDARGTRSRGMS